MPDFPIVDAHVHLWDPRRFRMHWLDELPSLNVPYGLAEYDAATAGVTVEALVYLQVDVAPAYGLLEAKEIVELAQRDQRIQAIVAWAPLEDGDCVRSYLEALVAYGGTICGIRRLTQAEPDPAFCLQPGFVRGVQILPEFGLTCDLCLTYRQLAETIELVRRCPETSFILDHIAKPNIRGKELDPWRAQIAELASLPNIVCKISGVVTEAEHETWTIDDIAPYVRHVLDAFGEDRVVFASDWPVVTLAASYQRWVDTVDELTSHLSAEARRKLWAENARRFYRL